MVSASTAPTKALLAVAVTVLAMGYYRAAYLEVVTLACKWETRP